MINDALPYCAVSGLVYNTRGLAYDICDLVLQTREQVTTSVSFYLYSSKIQIPVAGINTTNKEMKVHFINLSGSVIYHSCDRIIANTLKEVLIQVIITDCKLQCTVDSI